MKEPKIECRLPGCLMNRLPVHFNNPLTKGGRHEKATHKL
jgi:hypothetical protein